MGRLGSLTAGLYLEWQKAANKPFIIIAVMCVIVALAEAFGKIIGDGSKISILLGLAIITLLAPKIESLSLGSEGIKAALNKIDDKNISATSEVDANLNQKLDQLFVEVAALREMVSSIGGVTTSVVPFAESIELPPPTHADDPHKGRFGGKEQSKGRILCATVEAPTLKGGWCNVTLIVRAAKGGPPVTGKVVFFLHDSFSPDQYVVAAERGEARLVIRAYGAFTAGAIVDATTTLELDLSDSPNVAAPQEWRQR